MKTKLLYFLLIAIFISCSKNDDNGSTGPDPIPPGETLYVNGKDLIFPNDEKIILRGVNYPIIDAMRIDDMAQVKAQIDQAALTESNAIRFPWYTDGVHFWDFPEYSGPGTVDGWVTDGSLQEMLEYAHQKGMIPILELHDPNLYDENGNVKEYRITCSNNWNYFNNVVAPWWKRQEVLDIIAATQNYLIINLANEFGEARFIGNPPNAMETFKTNYNRLIADLRALNVNVPIMIDAPDCGTSSTELLSVAPEMLVADPKKNLIFSTHAYWHDYAPTQAQSDQKLDEIANSNLCFIIGEVANTQDVNDCGSQNITAIAENVLEKACTEQIGWLAWTYDQDCSAPREMTTDGNFANLTPWGELVVNNPQYGLKSNNGCGAQ
ncbi:MAG: cellulase family glycosylhydrolase [Aequorivita sp.]|nr:cellulase family glycosylhydrolase [Aequorivita sp.]